MAPFGPPPPGGPGPGGPPWRPNIDDATKKRLKNRDSEQNRIVTRWIIRNSKRHFPGIVGLMAFSVASSLASIAFALCSQNAVNSAVARDVNGLALFAAVLLGCALLQILIRAVSGYFGERVSAQIENSFRERLFDSILTRDYQQIGAYHSGDLMNRMTDDVGIIVSGVTSFLPAIAEIVANLVGAGSVLLLTDWRFCIIYIAATVVLVAVNRVYRSRIKRYSARVRECDGDVRSYYQDAIGSLLILRVFVTERRAKGQSAGLLGKFYDARLTRAKVRIKSNSIMGLSMNFGHVFALIWCSFQLVWGNISYGALVAIMQLTGQVRQPFISASNLSSQYYSIVASGERLMEIELLDAELSEDERSLLEEGFDARDLYPTLKSIDFENVRFSYRDATTLQNVSARVEKGDIVAIMGQSGCGKSTLFKLMLGMYRADSGRIVARGSELGSNAQWERPLGPVTRRLFAYVPQGNLLITGRLRDNIAFADQSVSDDEVWEALRIACADDFVGELPDGLDTVIGERGLGLSEGQMQRVAIARAYLSGAPVMLLDEATSSLDEDTEARVLENLKALDSMTCFIVTHRRAALRICNKTLKLQDGKVI